MGRAGGPRVSRLGVRLCVCQDPPRLGRAGQDQGTALGVGLALPVPVGSVKDSEGRRILN